MGQYIVEQLVARGDRVRVICRGSYPQLDALGVEVVRASIVDRNAVLDACRGIDVVYHVAGAAGIWGPWKHFYDVNVVGTKNVVEGCRLHGASRLVYTSSPSVTFDGADQKGVDESAPYSTHWFCHYPHTKAMAEQYVLAVNGQNGLSTCSLRPHLIWGPRDPHLTPRLLARAQDGRLRRVGNGTNLIDMVYVENAATAHLQAADSLEKGSPTAGRAYFISQGEPVNCWTWINEILALAGRPAIERSISLSAAYRLGATLEAFWRMLRLKNEPPMTRFLATQLGTSHYFDISQACRDFGYRPAVSTEEGMRRLGEDLRKSKQ